MRFKTLAESCDSNTVQLILVQIVSKEETARFLNSVVKGIFLVIFNAN